MRLSPELTVRPTQRLVMTPQLRQAIEALQLNSLELSSYIRSQVEENPFLELDEEEPAAPEPEDPQPAGDDEPLDPPEFPAPQPSLADRLTEDFRLETGDGTLIRAGAYLAGNLDDNGYLRISPGETARALGVGEERVLAALRLLRALEPGVGGRDLRECLLLQIGDQDPLLRILVRDHLGELAAGRLRGVADRLGIDAEAVGLALERLRQLEPRPGRTWSAPGGNPAVVPDLRFERVDDDFVVLVEEPNPRARLNLCYRRWLEEGQAAEDAEVRRYLLSRMNAAVWVLRCLEQRRVTLLRVGQAILDRQADFFRKGTRHLHPLTMREIADRVGVHESTVSRAVANKHALTPHGTFPLRVFFAGGMACRGGEALSAVSVKRLIRDLAAGEDRRRPLSDQDLASELGRRGIRISRRTVSKYRQELGLAPSAARARFGGAT